MYIVAEQWTDKEKDELSLFGEKFFSTAEDAIANYQSRIGSTGRKLLMLKVLQVKVVIEDFDAAGPLQHALDK